MTTFMNTSNLIDVHVNIIVEVASCKMATAEILKFRIGQTVQFETLYGTPVIVKVNGQAFARAEIIIVDERFGVRITEVLAA